MWTWQALWLLTISLQWGGMLQPPPEPAARAEAAVLTAPEVGPDWVTVVREVTYLPEQNPGTPFALPGQTTSFAIHLRQPSVDAVIAAGLDPAVAIFGPLTELEAALGPEGFAAWTAELEQVIVGVTVWDAPLPPRPVIPVENTVIPRGDFERLPVDGPSVGAETQWEGYRFQLAGGLQDAYGVEFRVGDNKGWVTVSGPPDRVSVERTAELATLVHQYLTNS
jgi:hypothetical protein